MVPKGLGAQLLKSLFIKRGEETSDNYQFIKNYQQIVQYICTVNAKLMVWLETTNSHRGTDWL